MAPTAALRLAIRELHLLAILRYILVLLVVYGQLDTFVRGEPNWAGVYAIFGLFVEAGYGLTGTLRSARLHGAGGLRDYLIDHGKCIYPAYWTALAFSLLWLLLASQSPGPLVSSVYLPGSAHEWLRNIALVGLHRDFVPHVVPTAWMLHVGLCFCVLIGLGLSRTRWSTAAWLAGSFAWTVWACLSGAGFDDRFSTLAAASLPFALGSSLHDLPRRLPPWVSGAAVLLFVLHLSFAIDLWGDPRTPGAFYTSLALITVVVAGVRDVLLPGKLAVWDRRLGALAYPILLVQAQIGLLLGWLGWAPRGTLTLVFVSLPAIHLASLVLLIVVPPPVRPARTSSAGDERLGAAGPQWFPSRSTRLATLASLFGLLLAGLLGEGLLRAAAYVAVEPPPPAEPPELAGLPSIEGLFVLANPHLRANYRGALYTTNSLGIRGPELEMPEPADVFRIAMVGDSYTMGAGVRYEETFAEITERTLRATKDGRRLESVNVALAGSDLKGSVDFRLPIALEAGADMIVYGWTVNDIEGQYYRNRLFVRPTNPSLLFDLLGERIGYLRDIFWPSADSYVGELDENWFRNPEAWGEFAAAMDKLAQIGRSRDVCVIVYVLPQMSVFSRLHPYFRFYDLVAGAARDRGLFVVDGFSPFLGRRPEDYRCNPLDWHPNAAANVLLAQVLVDFMRGLPEECWEKRVPSSSSASTALPAP